MTEKIFEGQYSGEKILLRTHPHLAFFLIQKSPLIALYITIIIIVVLFAIFYNNIILSSAGVILTALMMILHIYHLYKNSRYTFTSRRCIFFIKKSLLKRSYREIHIVDLRHAIPKKWGILGAIFGYGTLIVKDKDENIITYEGISEHKNMSRYLGRIIDYIKIHGHTDDISPYIPNKIRKNKNSV